MRKSYIPLVAGIMSLPFALGGCGVSSPSQPSTEKTYFENLEELDTILNRHKEHSYELIDIDKDGDLDVLFDDDGHFTLGSLRKIYENRIPQSE